MAKDAGDFHFRRSFVAFKGRSLGKTLLEEFILWFLLPSFANWDSFPNHLPQQTRLFKKIISQYKRNVMRPTSKATTPFSDNKDMPPQSRSPIIQEHFSHLCCKIKSAHKHGSFFGGFF